MINSKIPTISLNKEKDIQMPIIGLGTWQLTGDDCYQSVQYALDVGYRHIDTAAAYNNHQIIAKALQEYPIFNKEPIPEGQKGIYREDLFITSKLWLDSFQYQEVLNAGQKALDELGLEYLDLYLLHWPNRTVPINETLEAMQLLKEQGKIESIGVSNFTIRHLEEALKTGVDISVNQVEYHPSLQQKELKDFCNSKNIVLEAYSPLGRGEDFNIPQVQEISHKYGVTSAQVIISWILSKGIPVIPKASKDKHIEDSFKSLDLYLEKEDLEMLDKLDSGNRLVNPSFADFDY
jgi:diketogulonate reductase-like aldo/keto reductase